MDNQPPEAEPARVKIASVSQTTTRRRRLRGWRILNTVILVIGFLGPWGLSGCAGSMTPITGWEIASNDVQLPLSIFEIGDPVGAILAIVFSTGPILIPLYMIVNFVQGVTITPDDQALRGVGMKLLGVGSIGLLLWGVVQYYYNGLLWGFWLTSTGVLSSLAAEIVDWRLQVQASKSEHYRAPQV